jgi:Prealbumin-like fold domain
VTYRRRGPTGPEASACTTTDDPSTTAHPVLRHAHVRGRARKSLIGLLLVAATVAAALLLPAVARADGPTYYSGQADYAPEQVVDLHGAGYAAGTTYEVPVMRPDGSIVNVDPVFHTATPGWQETTTDGSGNLTYNYQLDGIQGSYTARVYPADWNGDWSQTPIAQATFTDASQANLDQCANGQLGDPPQPCNSTDPSDWVNGNLGASKSHYFEGDSIPYRLRMSGLANGPHTVTISWDTTKSDKHAIDYITSFNRTVSAADPCAGVSSCSLGSATSFAIPADPQVTGAGVTPVAGNFTLIGGSITSVSSYSGGATFPTGDNSRQIAITFNATQSNPVLAWGGHISTRADWGANNSAVAIPGSPYHTSLVDLDGSGGSQDRSLSADAVIFPGSIKIIKDAQPDGSTSFSFTGSPSPLTNFSLVDDGTSANTKLFGNIIDFQTYNVSETVPTGWSNTAITCSVTSPNGGSQTVSIPSVAINLKEGENVTCTYTDVLQRVTLHVIKHVINDNGGTKTASDFTMSVTGGNPSPASFSGAESPGTTVSIDPNTAYSVGEGAVSGYTQTSASAGCSSATGIPAGGSATCTITNDDQAAHLKLVKHVTNDNGGTAVATDFTLTASGPTPISGAGGAESDVSAGTYSLSETSLPGYTAGSWSCTGGSQNGSSVALTNGQSATCDITNDDQPAKLIVIKHVINDNGGTKSASDFTMSVTGSSPSPNSFAGAESPGKNVTINAGSYSVSESGPSGYTESDSADCSGSIAVGQTKTCTITNDDQPGTLIVKKEVINDNGGTKVATDFSFSVSPGSSHQFLQDGADPLKGKNVLTVDAGSYNVTEDGTPIPGYTTSYLQGSITHTCSPVIVSNGGTATCTITNDDQAAHLTLVKHVTNDNGGTAKPTDFTLSATGPTPISGAGGASSDVNAGTYSLSETSLPGYTAGDWSCNGGSQNGSSVTLANGESATCDITNDDVQPKLIVIKHVIDDNGGTAVASDFNMFVFGSPGLSPNPANFPGDENGTTVTLNAGSYGTGESGVAGYSPSASAGCSGTIAVGQTKTCTWTNNDQPAHLIVIKHVVNDNGGTASAGDFQMGVTGSSPSPASFPGAESPGTNVTINAGSYSVGETGPSGYSESDSADCSGTIAVGETKTCTITNDDQPAKLIVIKHVINDNGGTAVASDFTMGVTGSSPSPASFPGAESPGTDVTINAGAYSVGETGPSGYAASYSADCTGSLSVGQTKTCTVTNDDIGPKLIVIKHVINDNGGTATASNFTMAVTGNSPNPGSFPGAESPGTSVNINAGAYSVTETGPSGYAESDSADCSGSIAVGQTKTCTITNDDVQPKLIVIKHVINDNGDTKQASDFAMHVTGSSPNPANFAGAESPGTTVGINAGAYNVTETQLYGYTSSSSADCSGSIAVGQTKTCMITNDDQPATIVVTKIIKPTGASTSFNFNTSGTGYNGFSLAGGQSNTQTVNAGTYTVMELVPLGWVLTGIGGSSDPNNPYNCTITGSGGSTGVGDLNTQTATIAAKNGDTVTCVFENTGQGTTRTQGFWATHSQLTKIAWFGGTDYGHTFPGVAAIAGIGDTSICGRDLNTLGKVMGAFWADVSKTSTGKKRSALDQARMQLLQQLIAAELNASAFGSVPPSGSFSAWETALCGTDQNAIKTAQQQAASFNSQGDNSTFTPGTSADSKTGRANADIAFWDVIKP